MLQSNLTQQRVLVVGDGSLFDTGVTQLLSERTDFLVYRETYTDDLAILDKIESERPDVILVCESGLLDSSRLLDLVSASQMAGELQIIVVRINKNVIDVYARPDPLAGRKIHRQRRILAGTGEDLINAVRR